MNWTIDLVTVLGLTAVSGSILTLLWIAVSSVIRERYGARLVYLLLRSVMVGYLLPIVYFVLKMQNTFASASDGYWFWVTPFIMDVAFWVSVIWGIGTGILILVQYPAVRQFRLICSRTIEAPLKYQNRLHDVCKQIGIKRRIKVYQGYNVTSPFIWGILSTRIYMPIRNYSDMELDMIFRHECMHYKQGDTFWKPAFGLCSSIFWFNPLVWLVYREMRYWAEGSCDVASQCEAWTKKEYFSVILRMMEESQSYMKSFAPMWFEKESELKWRLNCMKRYNGKIVKKGITACILAGMLVVGSVLIYASDRVIDRAYGEVYRATVEGEEEEVQPLVELEEYEGTVEDFEGLDIVEDDSAIATYSANTFIEWTVSANAVKKSQPFTMQANKTIQVSVIVTPSSKYVKVGIVCPDDSIKYVYSKGNITHTFTTTTAGSYRFYVENCNSTAVEVAGCFVK